MRVSQIRILHAGITYGDKLWVLLAGTKEVSRTVYLFTMRPTQCVVYSMSVSANLEGYCWKGLKIFRGVLVSYDGHYLEHVQTGFRGEYSND